MTFAAAKAFMVDAIFNTMGEECTYNGVTILAIEDAYTERISGDPGFIRPLFTLQIMQADVAQPKGGDAVIFRGEQYTVQDEPTGGGGIWRVDVAGKTIQI